MENKTYSIGGHEMSSEEMKEFSEWLNSLPESDQEEPQPELDPAEVASFYENTPQQ